MICDHLDHVGNHLQSSAMSAADVADFWGISDIVKYDVKRPVDRQEKLSSSVVQRQINHRE